MKFTSEQIGKAMAAKTAEELLAMAKAENVAMTEDEAAKIFAELHKTGEMSDAELDNIAGGKEDDAYYTNIYCEECGWQTRWDGIFHGYDNNIRIRYAGPCPNCGAAYLYAGSIDCY